MLAGRGRGLVVALVPGWGRLVLAMIGRAVVGPGLGHHGPREEREAQCDQKRSTEEVLHHGPNMVAQGS